MHDRVKNCDTAGRHINEATKQPHVLCAAECVSPSVVRTQTAFVTESDFENRSSRPCGNSFHQRIVRFIDFVWENVAGVNGTIVSGWRT